MRIAVLLLMAITFLYGIRMTASQPNFPAAAVGNAFAACPDSPNCVSTMAANEGQGMVPISWTASREAAVESIKSVVEKNFARANLVDQRENYLRFEFTSLIFRFVDDVEFLIDEEAQLIHFRSASRVGRSDLGVNRRRMDRIVAAMR